MVHQGSFAESSVEMYPTFRFTTFFDLMQDRDSLSLSIHIYIYTLTLCLDCFCSFMSPQYLLSTYYTARGSRFFTAEQVGKSILIKGSNRYSCPSTYIRTLLHVNVCNVYIYICAHIIYVYIYVYVHICIFGHPLLPQPLPVPSGFMGIDFGHHVVHQILVLPTALHQKSSNASSGNGSLLSGEPPIGS